MALPLETEEQANRRKNKNLVAWILVALFLFWGVYYGFFGDKGLQWATQQVVDSPKK